MPDSLKATLAETRKLLDRLRLSLAEDEHLLGMDELDQRLRAAEDRAARAMVSVELMKARNPGLRLSGPDAGSGEPR